MNLKIPLFQFSHIFLVELLKGVASSLGYTCMWRRLIIETPVSHQRSGQGHIRYLLLHVYIFLLASAWTNTSTDREFCQPSSLKKMYAWDLPIDWPTCHLGLSLYQAKHVLQRLLLSSCSMVCCWYQTSLLHTCLSPAMAAIHADVDYMGLPVRALKKLKICRIAWKHVPHSILIKFCVMESWNDLTGPLNQFQ